MSTVLSFSAVSAAASGAAVVNRRIGRASIQRVDRLRFLASSSFLTTATTTSNSNSKTSGSGRRDGSSAAGSDPSTATPVEPAIPMAGQFKNPIVGKLWASRQEAKLRLEERLSSMEGDHEPEPKTPTQSKTEISYPFSSDPYLREAYQNPWREVRLGRILEDLDAMAGNVAFHHVEGFPVIVTAGVDRIRLRKQPLLTDKASDMTLSGQVTWVGKSSMEIRMQFLDAGTHEEWLEAFFTFVTIDPETKKAVRVPPLLPQTAEERAHFELGALKARSKKLARKNKFTMGQPLQTEQALKTDQLAASLLEQAGPLLRMPSLADPHSILMSNTRLQNAQMAQPQVRNLHDRIFGGFLMRRAFELAFANAYMFGGVKPTFLEVDDISFESPVDVGDLLVFHSRVLYTRPEGDEVLESSYFEASDGGPLVMVEVEVWVTEPERTQARVSNTMHFTFSLAKGTPCRTVLPGNIDEARRMAERILTDEEQAGLRS